MKPNRTKYVIGLGAVLFLGAPLFALAFNAFGMSRAINTLGSSGIADPNRLSGNISVVLYATAGGLAGALIGFIVLVVSIVYYVNAGRRISSTRAEDTLH